MTTVLLTGANGQVGWELQRLLSASYSIIAPGREHLDLASPDSIRKAVREIKPSIILNPAAYTAVDKAETEPELAMAANGIAPSVLAEEAKLLGALLVHFSTDYVFDGSKPEPYTESDTPNPQSVYGSTKLAGERAVQAVDGKYLILRTSWVYGIHGGNFMKTILRLAKERSELRIVADQFGAPTWARLLATSTAQILNHWQATGFDKNLSGIYHLSAGGRTNWQQYAEEIVRLARQYDELLQGKVLTIHPIATHEYPLPAKRPANSDLATDKIKRTFGLNLPEWRDDLGACVRELYSSSAKPD